MQETCPQVTTQADFDFAQFISKRWFVQQQMATQYLPETWNFCVQAKYEDRSNTGFWGWNIQVKNYAEVCHNTSARLLLTNVVCSRLRPSMYSNAPLPLAHRHTK